MNWQLQCSELGQEGGQQVRHSLAWLGEMERLLLLLLLETLPLHPQLHLLFSCHQNWAQRWHGAGCALESSLEGQGELMGDGLAAGT